MPHNNQRFHPGHQLAEKRAALGLSASEVGRRAGVEASTITRIEAGTVEPTPETLKAIADVLDLPVEDLLAIPEWQLPAFTPYLRTKYQDMPDAAIAEMQQYFEQVARKHRISPSGPKPGEDE